MLWVVHPPAEPGTAQILALSKSSVAGRANGVLLVIPAGTKGVTHTAVWSSVKATAVSVPARIATPNRVGAVTRESGKTRRNKKPAASFRDLNMVQ